MKWEWEWEQGEWGTEMWNVTQKRMKRNVRVTSALVCVRVYAYIHVCVYFALMAIKSSSQVAFGVCTGCAASLDAPHRAALTVTKKYSWFL